MNVLNNLKIEPYGYSHGPKIGFKISGIEAGYQIDFSLIDQLLELRKGNIKYNTSRVSQEHYQILSGFTGNTTNGQTIWIEISQDSFRSSDYSQGMVRPGHADLSAYQKYGENWNFGGGGQFSGRLTILYVIAGEIARQVLNSITSAKIVAHISQVGDIIDQVTDYHQVSDISGDSFPMVDGSAKQRALNLLEQLKQDGDSIGGKVAIYISGLQRNYGDDFFNGLEAKISYLLFSIPAVKAVEFGIGTKFATAKGSEVVEDLQVVNKRVISNTNYNGGINGGIANLAAPIKIDVTIKPTSSIFKPISTVKYQDEEFVASKLELTGRHDAFIANRAIWPMIGLLYILFLDLEMEERC